MRNRLIVLMATVALLLVGAVPVSAAPGGVPGPPPGHGKSADDAGSGDVATPDDDVKQNGPPEWAKAYGKRIKDAYGIPYGHLQQCIRDAAGDETVDGDEAVADEVITGYEWTGVENQTWALDQLLDYLDSGYSEQTTFGGD